MKFSKVNSSFWIDEEVRNWDVKTKQLAIYILTNQHRNSEGLFRLPKYYMAGDLNLKLKEINEIVDTLIQADFIEYDDENSIILIKKALKYDPTRNKNHQKAAVKKLKELPKSDLFISFLSLAEKYNKSFALYLKKELPDYFNNNEDCNSNNYKGIYNGMGDGIKDGTGNSLELELPLELSPELIKSNGDCEDEIIFLESKISESSKEKAIFFTKKLIDLIIDNNPRAVVPKKSLDNNLFQKWITSLERLNRLGPLGAKAEENKGYTWKEIDKIIEFSQNNNFWKSNILSASKLRKQIVMLENQMNRTNNNDNSKSKIDMLAELYADAEGDEYDE